MSESSSSRRNRGAGLDRLLALRRNRVLRVVGLMSGTSADGIDAAVVDIAPGGVDVLAFATYPYPPAVREQVLAACRPGKAGVGDICHLNFALGHLFAEAVLRLARRARIPLSTLDLVGSHGQTIYHIPGGRPLGGRRIRSTLQIGEPSVIAERTGLATVADFRPRDIAAGGQGAPLVPLADFLLFRHARRTRAVQNIGGIANVTILPAGGGLEDVLAFDTGPGNMILDRLTQRLTRGRQQYDAGGRLAAQGTINRRLLDELMRHPFLRRRPPRTTGREEFGEQFTDALLDRALSAGLSPADILATAAAFTAACIADAYRRFSPRPVEEVILCGGGSRNPFLVRLLTALVHPAAVAVTDDFGIDADAKEAISFALLAERTLRGLSGNVPSATGARRAVVLGKIVP
jgi:anhydro-N-acetylmuramic acid kinase